MPRALGDEDALTDIQAPNRCWKVCLVARDHSDYAQEAQNSG